MLCTRRGSASSSSSVCGVVCGAVHLASFVFISDFWSSSPTCSVLFLVSFFCQLFFKACVSSRSFRMRTTNNSLSTMYSPVTASSPPSSGCTPAPTVNTPASPPSQPVSLPDTSALAQAISRALAESLPPLLSSLRDSSGGNSNMAATSGPLSSPSTSTQSPASFSSGTPGSTSQSSGTLVVILFQLTAHLTVPRLSLLSPLRPPPTCL